VKKFRILVIHDGKPGHFSQSYGLARLIASRCTRCDCEISSLRAKPRLKLLNRLLRYAAASQNAFLQKLILLFYRHTPLPSEAIDLVISFGGNVVALNIALSQYWRIPNVLVGSSYTIPESMISAHVSLKGDMGDSNAVASRLVVCRTEPRRCHRAGRALRANGQRLWAIFVGGDGSGYRYHDADWHRLGAALQAMSAQYGVRWLVSTSRRTGRQGNAILRSYLDASVCAASIWYEDESSEPLDAFIGAASRLFCTEDSLSMLAESLAMAKPVISLRPTDSSPSKTHRDALAYMVNMGLLLQLDFSALAQYRPHHYDPVKSYAAHLDEIFQRFIALGAVAATVQAQRTHYLNLNTAIQVPQL